MNTDFASNIPKIGLKEHNQKKIIDCGNNHRTVSGACFVFYQQKKKKQDKSVYTDLLFIFSLVKKRYIQLLSYMAYTLLVHLTQVFSI